MPIVQVNVWEGFGPDRARKVIEGITQVFEDMEIPRQAVEVIVQEIPKTHWGLGGEACSEKFKDE